MYESKVLPLLITIKIKSQSVNVELKNQNRVIHPVKQLAAHMIDDPSMFKTAADNTKTVTLCKIG